MHHLWLAYQYVHIYFLNISGVLQLNSPHPGDRHCLRRGDNIERQFADVDSSLSRLPRPSPRPFTEYRTDEWKCPKIGVYATSDWTAGQGVASKRNSQQLRSADDQMSQIRSIRAISHTDRKAKDGGFPIPFYPVNRSSLLKFLFLRASVLC